MLGIIAVIGVAATATIVTTLSATVLRNEQARKTSGALALAKQALVGRAASDDNRPGSLPCPDTTNDGLSDIVDSSGACVATVGRLPWQTLGLPDLRDADGERLWYALSQHFSDSSGNVINSNTLGQINITGAVVAENVVAIVFAPGAPVNGQTRKAETVNSSPSYLETYVNATTFSTSADGRTYNDRPLEINDQLMVVSAADVFSVVQRRVSTEVKNALTAYAAANGGSYPVPALPTNPGCLNATASQYCTSGTGTTGLIPATPDSAYPAAAALLDHSPSLEVTANNWFDKNNWRAVVQYQQSPAVTVGFTGVPSGNTAQIASTTYSMSVQ
ncbi:MAG: hypothetical protein ABIS45_10910 [Burkholderiales bacterium]